MFNMLFTFLCLILVSFLASYAWVKYLVNRGASQQLDTPNHRSMHTQATPTGAGLAIVAVMVLITLASLVGLSLLGWLDDQNKISVTQRFICFSLLAALATWKIGAVTQINLTSELSLNIPFFLAAILTVIGIVWLINLFNFMDGMDGIAGLQTLVAAICYSIWAILLNDFLLLSLLLSLCGACLGFLIWNWSPAKIFMGDVGSLAIGGLLAMIAIYLSNTHQVSIIAALLPLACFIYDTTYTVIKRALKGEKIYQAHRSHIYQQLATYGVNHSRIVVSYGLIATILSCLAIAIELTLIPTLAALLLALICILMLQFWLKRVKNRSLKAQN